MIAIMKHIRLAKLRLHRDTIRELEHDHLSRAAGGLVASGSQQGDSVTCPPPKNGEGSGCVTG
jgi:hypothetical protein